MRIAPLLSTALAVSASKYESTINDWISISQRVGSRLPSSLLSVAIQREGKIDVLLRALEDEVLDSLRTSAQDDIFAADNVSTLSTYWIGGIYEIFRLLRERKLSDSVESFELVLRYLELLRMPLEKHEIAKDRRLKNPLEMKRNPPNDDQSDFYTYNPSDLTRAHIMPTAMSQITGSLMWHVIDVRENKSFWVERRWLSDKILELWRPQLP